MSGLLSPFRAAWRALPFTKEAPPLVTVIELHGAIGAAGPGRRTLSHRRLEKTIEAAFKPSNLAAVALSINSPGGSAVQSRMIHNSIRRLAAEKKTPVLAFIEDVGASGGYILAISGDEIFADESSVVGSIGVIAAGFGFQEAASRLGVDRRVHTAGKSKSMLDPFEAEKPEDVARLQAILTTLHEQFIDLVKSRRGEKLGVQEDIFTGAFWTAPGAQERGLIDDFAQLDAALRARFGENVRIKRCAPRGNSLAQRLFAGGEEAVDGSPPLLDPESLLGAVEQRALWARFGL
ncbi:MAG: S49 family peptidase [Pseudomonadota bacterium]